MAPGIREKPDERGFKGPVSWLLGRELIASLKGTLLYTAFRGKLDSRDWMRPSEHSFVDKAVGGEFYFDYMADTGDSQKATYSIAYLCMSDIAIKGPSGWEDLPPDQIRRLINEKKLKVELMHREDPPDGNKQILPRGHFLFMGGDTSYHIADYTTLAERVQEPFWWAFKDLNLNCSDEELQDHPRRPLFGIPGNHDYYDALDGFNRQFRRPSTKENEANAEKNLPQLSLPSFERWQEASYVSLQLPFGWWLWGLDTQQGDIDPRQLQFFKERNNGKIPKKLIVATPEPSTVFGKYIDKDETMSLTFSKLGLMRLFLERGPAGLQEKEEIAPDECRLDISGDIHHYARYWGPDSKGGANNPSKNKRPAPAKSNYASVMSGLGGAFLHPSHTDIHELEKQALYPSEEASRKEVARRLFNPWNIYKGGYVFLVGMFIALIVYFGVVISPSGKPIAEKLDRLNIFLRDTLPMPGMLEPPLSTINDELSAESYLSTIGGTIRQLLADLMALLAGTGWPILTLIAVSFGAVWGSSWYFKHRLKQLENKDSGKRKLVLTDYAIGLGLILISVLTIAAPLIATLKQNPEGLANSLLFLVPLAWSLLAVAAIFKYSEVLSKQAKQSSKGKLRRYFRKWRYAPVWVLSACVAAILIFGTYKFGQGKATVLLFNLIFIGVVLLSTLGLMIWAASSGLELHRIKYVRTRGRKLRRVGNIFGFVVLGFWHGLLQLLTPLLLVRFISYWTGEHSVVSVMISVMVILLALSLFFSLMALVGIRLAQGNHRVLLVIIWVLSGILILGLSVIFHKPVESGSRYLVFYCALAAGIGAVTSCVWLGWYLAVALSFNAHNNEAGGASRIEEYKEFIRFRIDEEGLTGFVIAVDNPKINGSLLRPKIIDYFRLRPLVRTQENR